MADDPVMIVHVPWYATALLWLSLYLPMCRRALERAAMACMRVK